MKFLCEQCKAKYQIADEKVVGKTVRMKCRKCGHAIEVRAEVTEPSVSARLSSLPAPAARPPGPPKPAPRPPEPRKTSSLEAPAKPAAPPKPAPSPLAGAFKSAVQRDDEGSAPVDMSEVSGGDDWYVAVNGVPVGPIRVGEIRRKAALGAVTEDSLAWQEGLDEWRPLRSFPELAGIVREAAITGRTSAMPPTPRERLGSVPPPPPRMGQPRPPSPSRASFPQPPPPVSSFSAPPAARSNVVPITSRLATAEKIDSPPPAPPLTAPEVAPDPFALPATAASPPRAAAVVSPAPAPPTATVSASPPRGKKELPWIQLAMIAAALSFGAVAAYAIFFKPAPPPSPPTSVVLQLPPTPTTPPAPVAPPEPAGLGAPAAAATTAPAGPKTPVAAPRPAAPAPGRSLDLHSLTQNGTVTPGAEDPGSEGPKAPGQCYSEGQVQQVIGMHQVAIRRACWERTGSTRLTLNVGVAMTLAADGSVQSVAASSDDPAVGKCIESEVHGWHFPAMGCTQKTAFSFKFVRQ